MRERRMAKEIGRKERKRAGGREGEGKSHIMQYIDMYLKHKLVNMAPVAVDQYPFPHDLMYLPSVATEESGRANHFPRGRKFSFSRDL